MADRIDNVFQITVLLICAALALNRAVSRRSRRWTLAFFFFGSWALGDIYWMVCLLFFGSSPQVTVVCDLSWYASYIFLYMLLRHSAPPEPNGWKRLLPWLGPAFTAAMAAFFMQWGSVLSNLIYAALMGLLLFAVIVRLIGGERYRKQRLLLVMVLIHCLFEYGLWTSSCLFEYTLASPYYLFDFLLTVSFVGFLPAVRKAAEA